jgi:peptidoglycan/LPS O-acetylase OafA/YrhL
MLPETIPEGRPRLDFLHGIRGLAALTIVLFHVSLDTGPETAGRTQRAIQAPLLHGHLAVPVFLVLSGFLLAMPVVTNGLALRGGIRGFMSRRAMRILPPYYAAYLLGMLSFMGMHMLPPLLGIAPGPVVAQQVQAGYDVSNVAAHVLLVNNLSHAWNKGVDGMFWSIACEWQIYLLFAAVLLPLWRRAGLPAMLAASTLAAVAITEAFARGWCEYLLPWMIPIFTLGTAAAAVVFGSTPSAAAMRRWPWGAIAMLACVLMVAGVLLLDANAPLVMPMTLPVRYYFVSPRIRWIYDALAAVAGAMLIIWLAVGRQPGGRDGAVSRRVRRLLESPVLLGLGLFAYSLYLTHCIVIVFWVDATRFLAPYQVLHRVTIMLGATVLSLLVGYLFPLCFERRWMSRETRGMFTAVKTPPPCPS